MTVKHCFGAAVLCQCLLLQGSSDLHPNQPSSNAPHRFFVSAKGTPEGDGSAERPWDLATALSPSSRVRPGDTVWVRAGLYRGSFQSELTGSAAAPIIVRRYRDGRATIDGSLLVRGAHVTYWGLEVTNTNAQRVSPVAGSNPPEYVRPNGVIVHGTNIRIVNLVIHDAGGGIGLSEGAINAEVYGCLIYYNGWQGPDRGHGHGIYAQNLNGTKVIADNVIYGQFGYGLHVFGSEAAALRGFHIEGNVLFDNGTLASKRDAFDVLIGGGQSAERIVVKSNLTYRRNVKPIVRFGFAAAQLNRDLTLNDNYLVGLTEIRSWQQLTVTGNTFVGGPFLVDLELPVAAARAQHSWQNNYYYADPALSSPGPEAPFFIRRNTSRSALQFEAWRKATGFDAGSQFHVGRPSGISVFVRPNRYEPGRAHVIVYNWERASNVTIDLSGVLRTGDRYEIRDVQDPFGRPLVQGTLGVRAFGQFLTNLRLARQAPTSRVTLPLKRSSVAMPVGNIPARPLAIAPDFRVFLVTRVEH